MLNRQESALVRGWAQGISLSTLALHYNNAESVALTRRAIERLRVRLCEHARRHGQGAWADQLGKTIQDWPRRTAVVLVAIATIDRLGVAQPKLTDVPDQWLPQHLAVKVKADAFPSFAVLFDLVEQGGYFWWRAVPRLGAKTARALVQWLAAREDGFGRALPAGVLVKAKRSRVRVLRLVGLGSVSGQGPGLDTDPGTALVPLHQFSYPLQTGLPVAGAPAPTRLDGVDGRNRAPMQGDVFAAHDYEAVQRWLSLVADRPHTYRTYRKEGERLLLWGVYQRGKALSSLDVNDAVAYRDFLAALDAESGVAWVGRLPREAWIAPKYAPRGAGTWRPFAGALSPRSQHHALTIAQSLFQVLVREGYLLRNPFASLKTRTAVRTEVQVSHSFNAAQWDYLLSFLECEREQVTGAAARAYARNRFLIYLAYGTGLRLAELAAATLGDLRREAGEGLDDFFWVIRVVGKGNKLREVPLPDRVAQELVDYLKTRGLPVDLKDCDGRLPVIERLRKDDFEERESGPEMTLSPSNIYRGLKLCFARCADALEGEGNAVAAARFRAASTHWLRHTHGTLGVKAGIRQSTMRDSLGHANLATTGIYLNDDLIERKREMEKLFGGV